MVRRSVGILLTVAERAVCSGEISISKDVDPVLVLLLGLIELQLLVQRVISLLLGITPRTALIDEPMLCDHSATDLGFWTTPFDDLAITVPNFLIPIFYPEPCAIDDIGQFL